jgi:hypothetical protein
MISYSHKKQIRDKFFEFMGEVQFKKFVQALASACQKKHRLMFWQEDVWDKFLREEGFTFPIKFNDIYKIFSSDIRQVRVEIETKKGIICRISALMRQVRVKIETKKGAFRKKLDEEGRIDVPKSAKCPYYCTEEFRVGCTALRRQNPMANPTKIIGFDTSRCKGRHHLSCPVFKFTRAFRVF